MIATTAVTKGCVNHDVDGEGFDVASADGLRAALDLVDVYGWDSPVGGTVLRYAQVQVVRPVIRSFGMTGQHLRFAEATAWAVAWEILAGAAVRTADSPWGLVRSSVRRAVLGERLADLYATNPRTAWRIHRHRRHGAGFERRRKHGDWSRVADPAALAQPVSLTLLAEHGYEPPAPERDDPTLGERLDLIVNLLVEQRGHERSGHEPVKELISHDDVVDWTGSSAGEESGRGPRPVVPALRGPTCGTAARAAAAPRPRDVPARRPTGKL
jgi:hypothetical protein